MQPRGGTEILWGNLRKYVNWDILNSVNLIVSHCHPGLLTGDKPNILWQHLDTDQEAAQGIGDPGYVDRLECIVFVSHWQMEKWIQEFNLPRNKCVVLLNAIEHIDWVDRQEKGYRLIYTSTPWRGLEVLVEAFKLLDRRDICLDVYSSTVIYGKDYMPNAYNWLFDRCRQTPGINYRGYAANKAIIKALQASHIFAYPSIFAETSCLSAIEAGAAGCAICTTDLGALPETCGEWANFTPNEKSSLVERYAKDLDNTINGYWNNYGQLVQQVKYFNDRYSWNKRAVEWTELIGKICAK